MQKYIQDYFCNLTVAKGTQAVSYTLNEIFLSLNLVSYALYNLISYPHHQWFQYNPAGTHATALNQNTQTLLKSLKLLSLIEN